MRTAGALRQLTGGGRGDGAARLDRRADDDFPDGGDGACSLIGASAHDTLNGGAGDDVLRGGGGRDMFRFSRGGGADRIEDFR